MPNPRVNSSEKERLKALRRLRLMSLGRLPELDRLTAILARALGFPMSVVTLVEKEWVSVVGAYGVPNHGKIPRPETLCDQVIGKPEGFTIEDALADPAWAANRFVVNEPHLRSYAGVPILGAKGYAYGAVCILDSQEREITDFDLEVLHLAAEGVALALENRSRSQALDRHRADLLARTLRWFQAHLGTVDAG